MPDIIKMVALKRNIMAKCSPKHIVPPDLSFIIEYPSDSKIVEAVKKDPLLQNKMVDAARKIYDSLERQMATALTGPIVSRRRRARKAIALDPGRRVPAAAALARSVRSPR